MGEIGRKFISRQRKHRKLMSYSQDDVAFLLGLHSKTLISRWENGVTIPLGINLLRLAYIYHSLTEEIFRETYKQIKFEIEPREKKLAEMKLKRNEKKKKTGK
jgi:transcriptional regulator with XRE-family HTH domain